MIIEGNGKDFLKDEIDSIIFGLNSKKRYRLSVKYDKDYNPISFSVKSVLVVRS